MMMVGRGKETDDVGGGEEDDADETEERAGEQTEGLERTPTRPGKQSEKESGGRQDWHHEECPLETEKAT